MYTLLTKDKTRGLLLFKFWDETPGLRNVFIGYGGQWN